MPTPRIPERSSRRLSPLVLTVLHVSLLLCALYSVSAASTAGPVGTAGQSLWQNVVAVFDQLFGSSSTATTSTSVSDSTYVTGQDPYQNPPPPPPTTW